MKASNERLNLAILLDNYNYHRTLHPDDFNFLRTFANILNEGPGPEKMDEGFMMKLLTDADVCITGWGTPKLTKSVLDHAPGLKLIAHAAGTPKSIVTEEVWKRGIRVFTAAPVIAIDVAETALGAIIYSLKCMRQYDHIVRSGIWAEDESVVSKQKYFMRRLNYRLTVGVVGASHVGRNLIKFLKPFGVKVKLYDPYLTTFKAQELGATKVSLEELMSTSDVVSIHAPNITQTHQLINREKLALMKDGSLFVNTARSTIVDNQALMDELQSGRINAYLDVYDNEPLPKDSPYYKLENVLLTPHISGGHTVDGGYERGNYVIQQLYSYHKTGMLCDETVEDMLETMG